MKLKLKNKKAFTLVELLVVVIIIGILAAIALPQYQEYIGKSRFSTIKTIARGIAEAEEFYYLQTGSYTDEFAKLDITNPKGVSCHLWACQGCQKAVACYTYVNKVQMAYYQFFSNDQPSVAIIHAGERACLTFSTNQTDYANRVCQNDTGHKGSCASTYCTYVY